MRKLEILNRVKSPSLKSKSNYVGVELELYSPYDESYIEGKAIELGLEKYIHIGNDNSIKPEDPEEEGYEIRVLCKEEELEVVFSRVQKLLKEIKAECNASCGLHVHLDMRNRNKHKCFYTLCAHSEIIKTMVARHRRKNHYCSFDSFDKDEKYQAINHDTGYETVEVRCHEMTLDMGEVIEWASFLLDIIEGRKLNVGYIKTKIKGAANL